MPAEILYKHRTMRFICQNNTVNRRNAIGMSVLAASAWLSMPGIMV
jgi:hypothetical protein